MRIIDFGASTRFRDHNDQQIELKDFTGTLQYMAPEIFQGSYDERCDIWSLGVIAYIMFSQGKYPFNDSNEHNILKKVKKGKFYLPRKKHDKKD